MKFLEVELLVKQVCRTSVENKDDIHFVMFYRLYLVILRQIKCYNQC